MPSSSVLHVLSGGGGWGNPALHDPADRVRDVAQGLEGRFPRSAAVLAGGILGVLSGGFTRVFPGQSPGVSADWNSRKICTEFSEVITEFITENLHACVGEI